MLNDIYLQASDEGKKFLERLLNLTHGDCVNCGSANNLIPHESCVDCEQEWIKKDKLEVLTWHALTEYEVNLDVPHYTFDVHHVLEFYDIAHQLGYYTCEVEDKYDEDLVAEYIEDHISFLMRYPKFQISIGE